MKKNSILMLTLLFVLSGCLSLGGPIVVTNVCPPYPAPSAHVVEVLTPIIIGDDDVKGWLEMVDHELGRGSTSEDEPLLPNPGAIERIRPLASGDPEVLEWFNDLFKLQQMLATCQ